MRKHVKTRRWYRMPVQNASQIYSGVKEGGRTQFEFSLLRLHAGNERNRKNVDSCSTDRSLSNCGVKGTIEASAEQIRDTWKKKHMANSIFYIWNFLRNIVERKLELVYDVRKAGEKAYLKREASPTRILMASLFDACR